MTAEELARRLITLIFAGRNRRDMIRRELPRTKRAGWVRKPFRIKRRRVLLFVESCAVIGSAVQERFTVKLPVLDDTVLRCAPRWPRQSPAVHVPARSQSDFCFCRGPQAPCSACANDAAPSKLCAWFRQPRP